MYPQKYPRPLVAIPALVNGQQKPCAFCSRPIMQRVLKNGRMESPAVAGYRKFCGVDCMANSKSTRLALELQGTIPRTLAGERPLCINEGCNRKAEKGLKGRWRTRCLLCRRPNSLDSLKKRVDYGTKRYKMRNFSDEQFKADIDKQRGCCRICRNPFQFEKREPHVDHCHATNLYRAPLCAKCNNMLGCANDNIETLWAAIKYLHDFDFSEEKVV